MAGCSEIGEVFETRRDAHFEWVIPDFLDLPEEFNVCFRSPCIPLTDTSWYMTIYPNGMRRYDTKGWVGLFLHREDSGNPVTVHYQLGIKRVLGQKDIIFGQWVSLQTGDPGAGGAWYLCRATMNDRLPELVLSNRLTVTCYLSCEAHKSLKGGRLLSSATQTEISGITIEGNSRSRKDGISSEGAKSIGRDIRSEAELFSIATQSQGRLFSRATQTGRRLLSSATQTGIRFLSSATQTGRRLLSSATQTEGRLLSSATQTEGGLLSSASQTEISDIIFGEENSRREEVKTPFDSEGKRLLSSATQTEISDLTIGEENSCKEDNAPSKSFFDEAAQTDEHVEENPERTKEFEKIRQKFRLWMEQPDKGDCIRRLRKEHLKPRFERTYSKSSEVDLTCLNDGLS